MFRRPPKPGVVYPPTGSNKLKGLPSFDKLRMTLVRLRMTLIRLRMTLVRLRMTLEYRLYRGGDLLFVHLALHDFADDAAAVDEHVHRQPVHVVRGLQCSVVHHGG